MLMIFFTNVPIVDLHHLLLGLPNLPVGLGVLPVLCVDNVGHVGVHLLLESLHLQSVVTCGYRGCWQKLVIENKILIAITIL